MAITGEQENSVGRYADLWFREMCIRDSPQAKLEELAAALETTPAYLLGLDVPCPPPGFEPVSYTHLGFFRLRGLVHRHTGPGRFSLSGQKADIAAAVLHQDVYKRQARYPP